MRLALVVGGVLAIISDSPAQPDGMTEPVPNAVAMVVGARKGREVARWSGEILWQGPSEIQFTGRRKGKTWHWRPHKPAQLHILASDARPQGISVDVWAKDKKARKVIIVIAPRPGNATSTTRVKAESWTKKRHRRESADSSPKQKRTSPDVTTHTSVELPSNDADAQAMVGDVPANGMGEQGVWLGRGRTGEEAYDGLGTDKGRARGYASGSIHASRVQNKGADLVRGRGGHTPADGGKKDGSAAGSQGADGTLQGLDWLGLIDAPEKIAPLVSAALILADANFISFGQRFLSRVVRGLGVRALRQELAKDAARVIAHDMARVRDRLARSPRYRSLPSSEKQAILKRTEMAMERAYYKKASAHFREHAEMYDALAATYRKRTSDIARHTVLLGGQNGTAYRRMALAAKEGLQQARASAKAARKVAKATQKRIESAGRKLDKAKARARARGSVQGNGGLRWKRRSRVVFEGREVRAVRDLSHLSDTDLHKMADTGKAATDRSGNTLNIHHTDQNADASYFVEISSKRHSIHNRKQHPKGNTKGQGLSPTERAEFDRWRARYWRARARDELARRGLLP